MRHAHRLLVFLGVLALLLGLTAVSALGEGRFPDGVIEIPQGTRVIIDDDHSAVTLVQPPVIPKSGDTFVIYLQDLPIAYVAEDVTVSADTAVIRVHRADRSVYGGLEESGAVMLTPEMYTFVPAANSSVEVGEHLKFEDGQVIVTVNPTAGTKVSVVLSNLCLEHSFSSGNIEVSLSGEYEIGTGFSVDEDDLEREIELGEIRIYGVGKLALSIDVTCEASLKYVFRGYFKVGISCDDDGNRLIKAFDAFSPTIEGKGRVNLALKVTAGVDVLVAEADLFAEIGVASQVETQYRNHPDEDPPYSTHCEEHSFFLFSRVGAEAKYLSALGQMKRIAAADFDLLDEEKAPIRFGVHFENGLRVDGCSEGMEPPPSSTSIATAK